MSAAFYDKLREHIVASSLSYIHSGNPDDSTISVEGIYTPEALDRLKALVDGITRDLPAGVKIHTDGNARVFPVRNSNGGISVGAYYFRLVAA